MKKAEILGRLTDDPVLREFGTSRLCTFTLADDDTVNGIKQTDLTDIHCWGKHAEFAAKHFKKGKRVFVSGRLTYETHTDPDGNPRQAVQVTADFLDFADVADFII